MAVLVTLPAIAAPASTLVRRESSSRRADRLGLDTPARC
jgi:hypothetical protein